MAVGGEVTGDDNNKKFSDILYRINIMNIHSSSRVLICLTFLNPTKLGNRHPKLLPNPRIRPDTGDHTPRRTDTPGRQTDTPSLGQTFDKHIPSESASFVSSEDGCHGDPYVFSFDGAVHECGV
jgi:hypothetical protein